VGRKEGPSSLLAKWVLVYGKMKRKSEKTKKKIQQGLRNAKGRVFKTFHMWE